MNLRRMELVGWSLTALAFAAFYAAFLTDTLAGVAVAIVIPIAGAVGGLIAAVTAVLRRRWRYAPVGLAAMLLFAGLLLLVSAPPS